MISDPQKLPAGEVSAAVHCSPPRLRFDAAASERAHKEWKASCGPHALAAVCKVSLSDVRTIMPHAKGWMNPTHIGEAMIRLGVGYIRTTNLKCKTLMPGINRIQFEGAWLAPGKPAAAAYHYTHWVAMRGGHVLDTVIDSALWLPLTAWHDMINDYAADPPSTGWHVTHWYQVKEGNAEPSDRL